MGFPIRIDGLLYKIETTYGTDPVPAAGIDGVKLSDRLWATLSVDWEFPNDRGDEATGTLQGGRPAPPQGPNVTLDIPVRARRAPSIAARPPPSPARGSNGRRRGSSRSPGRPARAK